MEFKYTKKQVARGTLPDAETYSEVILIKKCEVIYLTYQIKLLAYLACDKKKKLIIFTPKSTKIHNSLREFIRNNKKIIKIKRT